jgi:hypothetical protein
MANTLAINSFCNSIFFMAILFKVQTNIAKTPAHGRDAALSDGAAGAKPIFRV